MAPDLKKASSFPFPLMIRRSMYVFCFSLALVGFAVFFFFNNYNNNSTTPIWVNSDYRSQFSTLLSHFFPISSSSYPDDFIARSQNGYPSIDQEHDGSSEIEHKEEENWAESINQCDLYNGSWVRDESYPLYEAGSCPHIDEQFNCFINGRSDRMYEGFRWQPNGCKIPRLNGTELLEFLRGKRLVYVGDSLNRNMWESMICILWSSVKNKSKVFEASNRGDFRAENSYSFIFEDYNCSVEFYRTSFLVQQWEATDTSGLKKSTLRLDTVDEFYERFKTADILLFNTGHWWTRGRTSRGKGYFQESSQIYRKLNVLEAFRRAMMTWARWVDANVDPAKTQVFFRSYSPSHFRGGQWNSGGQCDSEVEPITDDHYLSEHPQKMKILEEVMKGMKTQVLYLNITRMTDYRKDAHPSIFRKQNLTEDEKKSALIHQDCSHWCLPGVPDTWNEILYAHILKNH